MPNDFGRSIASPRISRLRDRQEALGAPSAGRSLTPAAPQRTEAPERPTAPTSPRTTLQAFEDIARRTQVPVNVLLSDPRLAQIDTPDAAVELGERIAAEMQPHFTEGRGLTDALRSAIGDDRLAQARVEQSLAVARDLYPDRFEDKSLGENLARSLGGSAVEGLGVIAHYASGQAERMGEFMQRTRAAGGAWRLLGIALDRMGVAADDLGRSIRGGMDPQALQAVADSTPSGDILDPSTWELGENPSAEGMALLVANVLGSLAPVVVSTIVTRNPMVGAGVGGAQGGGAAEETAREIVYEAYDSGSLEETSAYYRDLIESGMASDEAARRTAEAAAFWAGTFAAPVAGLGGYATGVIVRGGTGRLVGGGIVRRVTGGAVVGALEEGLQEAAEGVAAREGVNLGAGMDVNSTEETFGDFLMGAMGGGPVGAAGGIAAPPLSRGADDDLLDDTVAPEDTAPIPSDLPNRGSGPVTGAAEPDRTQQPPSSGRISQALDASPARLPDAEAGDRVTITHPTSGNDPVEGILIGEDAEGIHVMVGDQRFTFDNDMLADGYMVSADGPLAAETATAQVEPPAPPAQETNDAADLSEGFQAIGQGVGDAIGDAMVRNASNRDLTNADLSLTEQLIRLVLVRGGNVSTELIRELDSLADEAREFGDRDQMNRFLRSHMQAYFDEIPDGPAGRPVQPDLDVDIPPPISGPETETETAPAPSPADQAEPGGVSEPAAPPDTGDLFDSLLDEEAGPATAIDEAAAEAATEPTDAQKEAGNYKKGHTKVFGFDVAIENARGSERRGKSPDGSEWSVTMPAHYGYIKRTEGADGDQVDVYVAEGATEERVDDAPVFVVNQVNPDNSEFDEHKAILGAADEATALALYDGGFSDGRGPERRASVAEMTVGEFREWVRNGDTTKPIPPRNAVADETRQDEDRDEAGDAGGADGSGATGTPQETPEGATGPDVGPLTREQARRAIEGWYQMDRPKTGGGARVDGMLVTISFDQWWGKNRVKKPKGKIFITGPNALDAWVFEQSAFKAAAEPEAAPAAPPVTPAPAQDTPAARWDAFDAEQRQAALMKTSFVGKRGKLVKPAQDSLSRPFDKLGKAVKAEVERVLGDDAAHRAILQETQADADIAEPLPNPNDPGAWPKPETPPETTPKKADQPKRKKLEDFGEQILGARKDQAKAFVDNLNDALPEDIWDMDISLPAFFPVPDYKALEANGVSKRVIGAVALVRASIRANPGKGSYRYTDFIGDLRDMRRVASEVLAGEITPEDAVKKAEYSNTEPSLWLDFVEGMADLDDLRFAVKYRTRVGYKYDAATKERVIGSYRFTARADNNWTSGYGETREEFAEKFRAQIEKDKERAKDRGGNKGRKPITLSANGIRGRSGAAIWYKLPNQRSKPYRYYDDLAEARAYLNANRDEILEELEDKRDGLNERLKDNPPRVGGRYRDGDVTPKMFTETFGFRGVQFGNWNNINDRQERLNDTWDALHDLAGVLDVPLKALSLDGKLGLAFGARGRGGRNPAAAHYEPGQVVINLTRKSGAGTLAHEWFHAVDHASNKAVRGGNTPILLTEAKGLYQLPEQASMSKEEYDAWQKHVRALVKRSAPWVKRAKEADEFRSKPYYGTPVELAARAFEKLVVDRLRMRKMQNGFLANIDQGSGAYPTTREMRRQGVTETFDDVLAFIATRFADKGDKKVTLPKPDPSLLDDSIPQVGQTWNGPNDNTLSIQSIDGQNVVLAVTNAEGKTTELDQTLSQVEDLIEKHEEYNDPKKIEERQEREKKAKEAEAEAARAKAEEATKREAKWGGLITQAEQLVAQFLDETKRKPEGIEKNLGRYSTRYRMDHGARLTTAGFILHLLRDNGGTYPMQANGRLNIWNGPDLKVHGDFAKWVMEKGIEIAPERKTQAELDAEFDALLDEEAGAGSETGSAPSVADDTKPRSNRDTAKSAAKNAKTALGEAAAGLNALFGSGDGTRLGSGPTFDEETWEAAKPHFKAAVVALGEATKDATELLRGLIKALLGAGLERDAVAGMKPYVTRYVDEVVAGTIDPWSEGGDTATPEGDGNASVNSDTGRPGGADRGGVEAQLPGGAGARTGGGDPERGGSPSQPGGERDRGAAGGVAGSEPGAGVRDGGGNVSGPAPDLLSGENPGNFQITDDFALGKGTPKERLANNIAALRLVKTLDAEARYPTKDEQATLARYVGWGGLSRAFDVKDAESTNVWGEAYRALKELLTEAEYQEALKSTRNAHFTSRTVVDAMWKAMGHLGVKGGRGLEPTVGTGNFLGLQPKADDGSTQWYGAELDPFTGKIAQYLYPDATIMAGTGFQSAPFNFGAFDFAIGNPPFGDDPVRDTTPGNDDLNGLKIHNYVMAKTARHLRPGGIMGMVVTARFLDGASNAEGRNLLAKDMKFLGAVRLPNTAFKENAGTEVVTDIVFFQKAMPGETIDHSASGWLGSTEIDLGETKHAISSYFHANPQFVLGTNSSAGTQYKANEYTVEDDGRDLRGALNTALRKALPAGTFGDPVDIQIAALSADQRSDLPLGGLALLDDGSIIMNRPTTGTSGAVETVTERSPWTNDAAKWSRAENAVKALREAKTAEETAEAASEVVDAATRFMSWNAKDEKWVKKKSGPKAQMALYRIADAGAMAAETDAKVRWTAALRDDLTEVVKRAQSQQIGKDKLARLKAILALRNKVSDLMALERSVDGSETADMRKLRKALARDYTAFTKKYGFLGDKANTDVLRGDIGVEQALEQQYRKPTGAKSQGTYTPAKADLGDILEKRVLYPIKSVEKADTPEDALLVSLQERGRVDLPFMASLTGQTVPEVREALTQGDAPMLFLDPAKDTYVFREEYLSGNVKRKLKEATEEGLETNIAALQEVQPADLPAERISPNIGAPWLPVDVLSEFFEDLGAQQPKVVRDLVTGVTDVEIAHFQPSALGTAFQHPRADFKRLATAAITGKAIIITDTIDKKQVKNEEMSKSATALADQMAQLFQQWAFQSESRTEKLVAVYNELMNTNAERVWDGETYLRPRGGNEEKIAGMRRTQKNGAWRMIQSRASLMHHVVGAGKTWTAVMAIMERKRLGLSRKPMVAVPNHMTGEWASQWYQVYPGARLLVVGGKNFSAIERKRMLARIASSDVDAIIISHNALGYIENDVEIEKAMIADTISTMQSALNEARENGSSKRTIKQMGKRIEKYQDKLKNLQSRKTDSVQGVNFEQLGVDYLAVDEAHLFKNLEYFTLGDRLVGMNDPKGSKAAFDLFLKTRSILTRYGDAGGIAFLTGTPVSNSLVEIYTMLKYLQYDELKARGMAEFDAFAGNFIRAETRFEITASQQVKERRVLAGLINLDGLSQQYREVADIILRPQLERLYTEETREWNARNPDKPQKVERFPTPKIKSGNTEGKRRLLTAQATETQRQVTDWLVARTAAIKANRGNKEYLKVDNDLWVLTDARKSGLDPRTIDPTLERDENSKVNRAAKEIKRIYDAWQDDKGVQLVFSDLSTPVATAKTDGVAQLKGYAKSLLGDKPGLDWFNAKIDGGASYLDTWEMLNERAVEMLDDDTLSDAERAKVEKWVEDVDDDMESLMATLDSGFSMYDDLKSVLIDTHGLAESEIAFIHDAKNDEQKEDLFRRARAGEVRVFIGSTAKMGAGTNIQDRLVALHHLDAPWRPSDVEQREGRIIRQKNKLFERDPEGFSVELLAYSTEGTSDVVMWQVLERKAAGIEQFLSGSVDELSEGESDSASFAEFMAQSTGDNVFREKLAQDAILTRLRSTIEGQEIGRSAAVRELTFANDTITNQRRQKSAADALVPALQPLKDFIAGWPEEKARRDAEIEAAKASGKKEPEFDALSGLEELAAVQADVEAKYRAAHDRWIANVEKARAARDEARASNLPESKWPDIPASPSRPGVLSAPVRERSALAQRIYEALGNIDVDAVADQTATVSLGNKVGKLHFVGKARISGLTGKTTGLTTLRAFLEPPGDHGRVLLGVQQTSKPQTAPDISRSLWPGRIVSTVAETQADLESSIKRMEDRIPSLQQTAEMQVDRTELEAAEVASTYFGILQSMAEKQAELDRLSRGFNSFIARDKKRSLGGNSKNATQFLTKEGKVEFDGATFSGFERGIMATMGDGSYSFHYVATRDDGEKGIITFNAPNTDPASAEPIRFIATPPSPTATENQHRRMTPGERAQSSKSALRRKLEAELASTGLKPAVSLEVVSRLFGKTRDGETVQLDARQRGRLIQVAMDADDPTGSLNHEIIHILRSPELWGQPFGLFTRTEWRILVKAARKRKGTMDRIKRTYPDLTEREQIEEVVAEMYRGWRASRPESLLPIASLLRRIGDFLRALGRAVTGAGYTTAHEVMTAIEGGVIGGRMQERDSSGKFTKDSALKGLPERHSRRDAEANKIGRRVIDETMYLGKGVGQMAANVGRSLGSLRTAQGRSNALTDAMVGRDSGRFSILALVPGNQLLADLAREIPSSRRYQRFKDEMDAVRNDWQARMAEISDKWSSMIARDPEANVEMMDIMHEATLTGADPTANAFKSTLTKKERDLLEERGVTGVDDDLKGRARKEQAAISAYQSLRQRFAALPRDMRDLYREIQKAYREQQDAFEEALVENIKKSQKAAAKTAERAYQKELQRIRDEGLKGTAAEKAKETAKKKRNHELASMEASMRTRITQLRLKFESAKVRGPYFPLSRFGEYYVTLRDDEGRVTSFSMFSSVSEQQAFINSEEAKAATTVEHGVMDNNEALREQIAPTFMADIQKLMGEASVDAQLMDEVWQRYLQTLPDASQRTKQIHRKGTPGFSKDAYRAFAHHMFHGAHQLARLKFGIDLTDALQDMREQVPLARDQNRARAVVNEIQHRHNFTMNPTGSPITQAITQLAFVWYLGVTPAAAMVNLSQTTVVGPGILAAQYSANIGKVTKVMGKAFADLGRGKGDISKSKNVTDEERKAIEEAYRRGVIDRTQAHDLAQIGETGIQYNSVQQKVMRAVSFFFHSAEVANREVTFLAAYRLAREAGMDADGAIDSADQSTYKIHFDYQNTSRPRFMQGDVAKVLFIFRNFTTNMIYRLVRDVHQSMHGETAAARKEARIQLAGITASMAMHAGIRGVWGYGLVTTLLGVFFPGGDDDVERHLQRMLIGEDDGTLLADIRRNVGGVILNGLPGHLTGTAMSERIGMPNLWFRENSRDLEGRDAFWYYVQEVLGPGVGLMGDFYTGFHGALFEPGNLARDLERTVPKFVRDAMRAARYSAEGVQTWRGDPILENVSVTDAIRQAIGFTPAAVAERYAANSRMLNRQTRIQAERRGILREMVDTLLDGGSITPSMTEDVIAFNRRYPMYAITNETLRRSLGSRRSRVERNEFGVALSPDLNQLIRGEEVPLIYGAN